MAVQNVIGPHRACARVFWQKDLQRNSVMGRVIAPLANVSSVMAAIIT